MSVPIDNGSGLYPLGTILNDVPGSPMDGDRGHWAWFDRADPLTHYPYWVPDPASDVKQRRTARDLFVTLRAEVAGLDATIATFKAIASPTVAQHRRFSVDVAEATSRIVKLQGRVALRLLDAGDGLTTETPMLAAGTGAD